MVLVHYQAQYRHYLLSVGGASTLSSAVVDTTLSVGGASTLSSAILSEHSKCRWC